MKLETKRLILRPFEKTESDLKAIFEIFSDLEVNKYLPWFPLASLDEASDFFDNKIKPIEDSDLGNYFAICLKDNQPIGYLNLDPDEGHDLGYGLKKEFWNQGIVSEAVAVYLEYLKTTELKFITATHDVNNVGSGKVMQKNGFEYQYSYVEQWQPKDIEVTFKLYQLNFEPNIPVFKKYWNMYEKHFI